MSITGFPGSRPTASGRINGSELEKMKLPEERRQSGLLFALNYIYREPQFWNRVVFTDEKTFQST